MKYIVCACGSLSLSFLFLTPPTVFALDDGQGSASSQPVQTVAKPVTIDIRQRQILKLDQTTSERLVISHDVLTFKNSDFRIDMGHSVELAKGIDPWPYYYGGYTDPKSLNVSWLIEGKIFRATWKTLPCGSGIYDTQVDVLVLLEGNTGRELLRESFLINARTDSHEHTCASITFSANKRNSANDMTILRTVETENVFVETDASKPLALGDDSHRQMSVVREVTRFELRPDGPLIENANTQAYIDLSEKYVDVQGAEVNMYKNDITLDELSDFLVLYVNSPSGSRRGEGVSTPQERKLMTEALKNINRGIANKPFCTGRIEIPHRRMLFPPLKPGQAPAG